MPLWTDSRTIDDDRDPLDEPTDEEAEYLSVLASMPQEPELSELAMCMMFLEQAPSLTSREGFIL